MDRAEKILDLGHDIDSGDLLDLIYAIGDGSAPIDTPLAELIRASFTSDDDMDDLIHEIEHLWGDCDGDDEDCPWFDDDDN